MVTTVDDVVGLRLVTSRLARRLRQHATVTETMTPSRLSALMTIQRRGPLRLGELAARERIGKSSVTRLVAKLEDAGFVERVVDPDDRRSSRVATTPLGDRLVARTNELADAYLTRQLAQLAPEDRAAIDAALPALERLLQVRA